MPDNLDIFEKNIFNCSLNINLSKMKDATVSLSTLCTDIFLIVTSMREQRDLGEPEKLRKLLTHYIELFMQNCGEMKIDSKIAEAIKLALVALIDETVLSIPGSCSEYWSARPLQFEYYGEQTAGDKFYQDLEGLMANAVFNYGALETFYYCLALGFEGKHLGQMDEREKVIRRLATVLINTRKQTRLQRKSPETVLKKKRAAFFLPPWLIMTITAGVAVMVWMGASIATRSFSQKIIRSIAVRHSEATNPY
jgi:type VI secretion system protein ImpK